MTTPEIEAAHAALRNALRHFADDEVVVEHGGWTETRILDLGDCRAEHVVTWGCRVGVGERYVDVVIRRTTELDRTTYQLLPSPRKKHWRPDPDGWARAAVQVLERVQQAQG